jgi:hypothetical protein
VSDSRRPNYCLTFSGFKSASRSASKLPWQTLPTKAKGFPGGGKEPPSRGQLVEIVTVIMQEISNPIIGRAGKVARVLARITGLTSVLAGLGFAAVLHNPGPAFSATYPGSYSVVLTWVGSPRPVVAGYRVYYGTASGNYTNSVVAGNVTTRTVSGLAGGVTYFFAVTAYDTNGLESTFSNEAIFVPGQPTVTLLAGTSGQVVLTISGLIGLAYDIQATQDFKTWSVIGTVTPGASGLVNFTDTNMAGFSRRFYRIRGKP